MISELEELAQGVAGPFMSVLSLLAIDESFSFIRRRLAAERQGCIQVGSAAGKCLPGHEPLELASVCARIHMQSEPAPAHALGGQVC